MFRNKRRHTSVRSMVFVVLSLGSMYAQAEAEDSVEAVAHPSHHLSGDYGFSTQQTCVRTVPLPPGVQGFDPNPPHRLLADAEIVNMGGIGTAHFTKDGTITVHGVGNEIRNTQVLAGQEPVHEGFDATCAGDYSIQPNNKVDVNFNCQIEAQSQPGLTIEAGPVNFEGWVGDRGQTVDLNLKGTVQTLTLSVNGAPVQTFDRLCIQRFTLYKLPKLVAN